MDDLKKREHAEAKRFIEITEAWTKCAHNVHGDYFVPAKEFAEGMWVAARSGADDAFLRSLGMSLARAVREGETRVAVMEHQWKTACGMIFGLANSYAIVVGYTPETAEDAHRL